MAEKERTPADEQRAGARLDDCCEGGIEFAFTGGFDDHDLRPDGATRLLHASQLGPGSRTLGSSNTAMTAALGTSSCSSPSRLAVKSAVVKTTPVILPPGRLRLETRPSSTGSRPS